MGVILGSPSRVTGTDGAGGRSAQAKRGLRMRESLSHGRGNGMVSFLGRLSILFAFGFRVFLWSGSDDGPEICGDAIASP